MHVLPQGSLPGVRDHLGRDPLLRRLPRGAPRARGGRGDWIALLVVLAAAGVLFWTLARVMVWTGVLVVGL